ncbi:MAG: DUF2807 domain-containing protein [Prevotellaceae bacterium]|jgi:hypothetical protein|nr:DUF2807 domain-containing protein [Prevotellaceae bacterium]
MKRFLYAIICIVLLSASCSDVIDLTGRDGKVEVPKDGFSGISVQDGFELYLIGGNTSTVVIESDENVINHNYVKSEVKNGILYFYRDPEVEYPDGVSVKIHVSKDSLDALTIISSKVQIDDTLRTNEIRLFCSDKSVLTGRLECKKLQSTINSSAVEITGISDTMQMNIGGGSSVKLYGMESNDAGISISGGSYAEVAVNGELEVKAKEKSILYYKGTAVIRTQALDDGSEIKKITE